MNLSRCWQRPEADGIGIPGAGVKGSVSCLVWVLGKELGSSARAVNAF